MGRKTRFVGGRAAWLAVVLGAWGSGSLAGAQDVSPLTAEQLFQRASRCVLRLEVEREAEPGASGPPTVGGGSAVVLSLDPPGFLTVATAYHVLARAKLLRLYAPGRPLAIARSDRAAAECFVDRSRELAFVRIPVDPTQMTGLAAVDTDQLAPVPQPDGRMSPSPTGLALGFSEEGSVPLDVKRVDILGLVSAGRLGLVRRVGFARAKGELVPDQMEFQLLGDQATLEGMSGGLVVNQAARFVGLVYGRRTDQFNLVIPAVHLVDPWRRARERLEKEHHWAPLSEAHLVLPGLFSTKPDATVIDRMDWGTFEGLTVLLSADPLGEIERFQEIVIVPPDRGESPPALEIYTLWSETVPNNDHSVEIWVNGEPSLIDPVTKKATLKLRELPGETMVTVIKKSGAVDDFELGKFLLPSRVDLAFQYEGEEPFRRVVRSLPVIAQSYPLFITVVNSPRVTPSAPKGPPANARLALRLDYAQAVLNQAPFTLEVDKRFVKLPGPGGHGDADFDAHFRLDPGNAWRLERMSPQRLGLTLTGDVVFNQKQLRYRDLVIHPGPGPDEKWPPRFILTGRFQFPYEMPGRAQNGDRLGFAVSPRLTGTRSIGSLRVDVREGLQFDAAGILRFLFTSYVNKTLIADNNQPHRIADEKIEPFLRQLGIAPPDGWNPEIRRAVFVHDPNTRHDWLIVTFRLDPERRRIEGQGERPGGDPPPGTDLLAPPKGRPGRVLTVEAWGVPGSLSEQFPGLGRNPAFGPLIKRARVNHLNLSLELKPDPAEWFKGLEPTDELLFLQTAGRTVAERILAALKYSADHAGDVTLRFEADPEAGTVADSGPMGPPARRPTTP